MASELFERIGQGQPSQAQQQNPKDAALNLLRQQGFSIPEGYENDPNTLIQMVMRSGRFPQNRLSLAQNVLTRLMGGR